MEQRGIEASGLEARKTGVGSQAYDRSWLRAQTGRGVELAVRRVGTVGHGLRVDDLHTEVRCATVPHVETPLKNSDAPDLVGRTSTSFKS